MKVIKTFFLMLAVLALMTAAGCDKKDSNTGSTNLSTAPVASPTQAGPSGLKTSATGTITANPNPIMVCDGSGLGITQVSWNFAGAKLVEVRVGSPDGALLAHAGGPGTTSTGKWVGKDSAFYLQDVTGGLPLTADNTIASAKVTVTAIGCH